MNVSNQVNKFHNTQIIWKLKREPKLKKLNNLLQYKLYRTNNNGNTTNSSNVSFQFLNVTNEKMNNVLVQ